jgi:hypothetical protein
MHDFKLVINTLIFKVLKGAVPSFHIVGCIRNAWHVDLLILKLTKAGLINLKEMQLLCSSC